jgi:hypothetical protein
VEDGLMSRHTDGTQFGPSDRIAAFAKATEVYAEGLEDPDLANVYWGKSLGLWQAFHILSAEEPVTESRQPRGPAVTCGPRRTDRTSRSVTARTVGSQPAVVTGGGSR